jgi:hypothetical protein
MAKNLIILCSLVLFLPKVYAQQNLVPNPSFEIYSACPDGINSGNPDQILKASGWQSTLVTPDYFHVCAPQSSMVSIPNNFAGSQFARSGNGYCGLHCYSPSILTREAISAQLLSPLTIGQKYFLTLHLCHANNNPYSCFGINKIGVLFSTIQYSTSAPPPINNFAHLYDTTIVTDSINWTKISGSFIADSMYQYINLGNFFDDSNTDTANVCGISNGGSYYYIDDLCVSSDSLTCQTVGIGELSDQELTFFPNPFIQSITLTLDNNMPIEEFYMYNSIGESVYSLRNIKMNSVKIHFPVLQAGFYLAKCITMDNKVFHLKLIRAN